MRVRNLLLVGLAIVGLTAFVGCSAGKTQEEMANFQASIKAQVKALQALGVEGIVVAHAEIDQIGSFNQVIEGPLKAEVYVFLEVEPEDASVTATVPHAKAQRGN